MTTVQNVIDQARIRLLGTTREQINKLNGALTASATSVAFTFDTGLVKAGSVLEIDLEQMYVWSVNGGTATVQRGWNGTFATSHADGSIVTVNPRFARKAMMDELNAELSSFSSPDAGLFQVVTVDTTYTGQSRMFEIPSAESVLRVLSVWWRDSTRDWVEVRQMRLASDQSPSEFPSGWAILLEEDIPTGPVRVTYAAPYDTVSSLYEDIETTTGLHRQAHDILALGVQVRMMTPREVARNFTETQGDTRRPDEVSPGAIQQSWQGLFRLRNNRVKEEAARLARMYPIKVAR